MDFDKLGLPKENLVKWFDEKNVPKFSEPASKQKPRKNPEIPVLDSYKEVPDSSFWSIFPSHDLPDYSKPITEVNVSEFKKIVSESKHLLTPEELDKCYEVIGNLSEGADAWVDESKLPETFQKNTNSIYDHETAVGFTDMLATFVKLGYVSGPFKRPPIKNLRVNQFLGFVTV